MPTDAELMKMIRRNIESKVLEIIPQTHDTKAVRFSIPHDFDYFPGQFAMVKITMKENDEFKIRNNKSSTQIRAFSISSSPAKKGILETAIKEEEDGFVSRYFVRYAQVGEPVILSGPHGKFFFEESMKDVVLIGAGSGITPLMGMIRYIADKNLQTKALLIYSNKTPADIVYDKEIFELSKRHPNIKHVHTLTRVNEEHKWDGYQGRINEEFLKKHISDVHRPYYFICGSPAFATDMVNLLKSMGIDEKKIHTEKW